MAKSKKGTLARRREQRKKFLEKIYFSFGYWDDEDQLVTEEKPGRDTPILTKE